VIDHQFAFSTLSSDKYPVSYRRIDDERIEDGRINDVPSKAIASLRRRRYLIRLSFS
jgi:hypothetical protein